MECGSVELLWTGSPSSTNENVDYEIERQTGSGAYELIATCSSSTGTKKYTDNSVVHLTTYNYRMKIKNDTNYSNTITVI